MRELWHYIGITPTAAVAVVLSTVTVYFVFGGMLRLWGQRLAASPRSLDLAVVTVLGAIVGRSTMGHVPTLAGGLMALGTLAALELTFRGLRRLPLPPLGRHGAGRGRAVVLAVAGKVQRDTLYRYGLTLPVLWSSMRQAGISHPSQAALVILEPNGRISVVRTGQPIHPRALLGVRGAHTLQEQLRAAGLMPASTSGDQPTPGRVSSTAGGAASAPVPRPAPEHVDQQTQGEDDQPAEDRTQGQ